MSIYKPKNSPHWHFDFQIKGRRFHGSTGQGSKPAARQVEARERIKAATTTTAARPTLLNDAAGLYYQEVATGQPSMATTRYQLRVLVDVLGANNYLADITQADLARYCARRRARLSNASVNRELQLARRIWRYAEQHLNADTGRIDWSSLMLKEATERVRELTADEEARLFAALRADYHDLVRFCLMAGPRRAGAIGLMWDDIDFRTARAVIRLKGGRTQKLPLTPAMVALIANQPRCGPQVFTYLCIRNSPGRERGKRYPVTASGLRRVWANAIKSAKIDDFRFHDLRHTAATRMVRANGNLKLAQKLLGHTRIETTARYSHVNDEDLMQALLEVESRNSPEQPINHLKKRHAKD